MYFLDLALETVTLALKPGATFVAKMFQGSGSDDYLKQLRGLVRQGADPQARRLAPQVARGLHRREGIQGRGDRTSRTTRSRKD